MKALNKINNSSTVVGDRTLSSHVGPQGRHVQRAKHPYSTHVFNLVSVLSNLSLRQFLFQFLCTRHTHTRLTALRPGLPGWAGTRKVKPIWILLKQETASGSDISWAVCKSAPHSRQITTPAPHRSVFLQAGCPFCCLTNIVKALKAESVITCNA